MSLRFVAILCLLMLMLGCTVTEYVDRPVRVEIPIPVPCDAEIPGAPDYATDVLTSMSTDGDIVRALLVEREQRAAAEALLRAELVGCTTYEF